MKHEGGYHPLKTNRKFLQIFTLCFCLVFVSAGCGNNDSNTNTGTQKPLDSTNQTGTTNTGTNTGVSASDSERRVLADRICRAVEGIEGQSTYYATGWTHVNAGDQIQIYTDISSVNPPSSGPYRQAFVEIWYYFEAD